MRPAKPTQLPGVPGPSLSAGLALFLSAVLSACGLFGAEGERELVVQREVRAPPELVHPRAREWLRRADYRIVVDDPGTYVQAERPLTTDDDTYGLLAISIAPGPAGRSRVSIRAWTEEDEDGEERREIEPLDQVTRADAGNLANHLTCAGGAPWPACP